MATAFTPESLARQLQTFPSAQRWLVGFSGGLDSTVLLHALVEIQKAGGQQRPLVAIHVNHGLSPSADAWQRHCEDVARGLEVPLHSQRVTVESSGKGWEEAARSARYRVFTEQLRQGDVLLLAHQLEDQAETVLFRLLRGAGPRGLAGMKIWRDLGPGHLLRPLLPFSRRQLTEYAQQRGLQWVEDDSNRDRGFDRNYLRHQIMPLLEQRWPGFERRWGQSADLCREADQLNQDLAAIDLQQCDPRRERVGHSLCLPALERLAAYRRNNLLRYWLRLHSAATPEQEHLVQVQQQLIDGDSTEAAVAWGDTCARRTAERLFLLPQVFFRSNSTDRLSLDWKHCPHPLRLPDGSQLQASAVRGRGLVANGGVLHIRWREGGERCRPQGRGHSQTLKKLLQEYGLEPWLRERVPIVYIDDKIAAVGDLWVCSEFAAAEDQQGLVLEWSYPGSGGFSIEALPQFC